MAWIYAVASAKGGVGKTTTTANLGATLAAAGHDVAVVDADLAMPNLAAALGVEAPDATVHDVLAGRASVDDATYHSDAGVDVVPGDDSLDAFADAEPTELNAVFSALESYEFVLVDTGSGLSHDAVLPLGLADAVFLVCNTERDALGDTDKTREVTERLGGTVAGVVLTRVDPENPNAEEVQTRLDAAVVEAIPADDAVTDSVAASVPVSTHAPDSPAAAAYAALAEAVEAYDPNTETDEETEARTDEISEAGERDEFDEADERGSEIADPADAESPDVELDDTRDTDAADGTLSIASAEAKLGADEVDSGFDDPAESNDPDEFAEPTHSADSADSPEPAERDETVEGEREEKTVEDDPAETDDEPLVDAIAEAEETAGTVELPENDEESAADTADEEDGVYDTALVEEAEHVETEPDESDDERPGEDDEAARADGERDSEGSRGEQKGFLGRLLR
ncbi:MinD/ParA family ATP-binding protein [Haloprofundus salinisoli]|uniref:MinD/ParA family ATP-binding protein n=1 Tax=Haloprofundus salinisoli TaxID=2876193 RepID=UPI001CCF66C1|nr:MinD/ParA family protein [Haloprofundus salinisoli]